jgi:hypothetical protein
MDPPIKSKDDSEVVGGFARRLNVVIVELDSTIHAIWEPKH